MSFFSHKQLHNPVLKKSILSANKVEALLGKEPLANPVKPISAGAIEARRLIAEAQLKYQHQQEKAMNAAPAQNERIQAALNEWGDEDTQTRAEPVTVGVSKAAFDYIRDNPYATTMQAVDALEKRGFKRTSLTSLYSQMVRQGHLSKDMDGRLTALIKEFRTLKSSSQMLKLSQRAQPPERQAPTVAIDIRAIKNRNKPEGIASLNAAPAQATPTTAAKPPTPLTAAQVLESLSIKEAHILYRELQTMFG